MNKLYKKDSKDNIRFWQVEVDGAEIIQTSGIVGTDSPVEHRKTATSKNVGRANETTPHEQAVSEAESKYKEKKRKGYFETKEQAETKTVIKPMLAKKYEDHEKKIDWSNKTSPVYVQPKLDGMRCLIIIEGEDIRLMSRGGKEITTMDHIKAVVDFINQPVILDGELYAHGKTFQENMKLIKKYREGKSEQVSLTAYDIVSKADYSYRYHLLSNIVKKADTSYLKLIRNELISSPEEMKKFHAEFLSGGYEGSMIRYGGAGYKIGGRSANLLKYKQFQDETYEVTAILPSEARPDHGIVVCITPEGKMFKASLKGSHDERKELLSNEQEYVGETAEIRFFEKTDDGLPRFPVCVGFRIDK